MSVSFYIPDDQWPDDIDRERPKYSWSNNRFGKWNWTLQTFQILSDHGIDCSMTWNLETEGIVFAHRGVIPNEYQPHRNQLIVCILAERVRHPFAQYHLLQDPHQQYLFNGTYFSRADRRILGQTSSYIRYWPQPGLMPRSPDRGDRFETIVFKGMPQQLALELRSEQFRSELESKSQLRWIIEHEKERWPDYRNVDAVLAVRSFSLTKHPRKPATKLYNAWIAGVPAILGAEYAFRTEGLPNHDYVEVGSVPETLAAIYSLRDNPQFRRQIVEAGRQKANHFSVDRLVEDWMQLLQMTLTPMLDRWKSFSGRERAFFFAHRGAAKLFRRLAKRASPTYNPYI